MAITINFQNVEKVVFSDSELKKKLPDFKKQFDGHAMSKLHPDMRAFGQKMLIEFVNLVEDKHAKIMADHFKQDVAVQQIDLNVCHNYEFGVDEAEEALNSMKILKEFIIAYREGDRLYLSTWR